MTNRFLALPIFAAVMFLVYYIAMVTVGSSATDWANDGLFGDGWHLFGIGSSAYTEAADEFTSASDIVNGYIDAASEQGIDTDAVAEALDTEAEDFDPELYDYDKLADGENDTFAEGKEYRGQSKKILLGIMYGRGAKSIAEQLFGVAASKEENEANVQKAQAIKDSVYTAFPKIKPFEDASQRMVREKGYVTTLWGRRRHLEDFNLPTINLYYVYKDNDGNEIKREDLEVVNIQRAISIKADYFALFSRKAKEAFLKKLEDNEGIVIVDNSSKISRASRQIINSRVQGSAADMSKLALIKIYNDEELTKRKVKLIIPVHDEILIETPLRYAKYVRQRFANDMETAARPVLTIPIKCDVETSIRWYDEQIDLDAELGSLAT